MEPRVCSAYDIWVREPAPPVEGKDGFLAHPSSFVEVNAQSFVNLIVVRAVRVFLWDSGQLGFSNGPGDSCGLLVVLMGGLPIVLE